MAQHDYVIANGTGAAVRSDLNNALAAIVSQNSGATAPATTYAFQFWADTTTGLLKLRNSANSAWITLFQLDGEWSTLPVENGTAAAPSIYFKDSGTDTGFYSPGTDQVAISTGGTGRLFINSSGSVGIGTSSPTGQLDVRGSATDFDGLRLLNTNTSSGTQTSAAIRLGITNSFGAVNGIRNCRIQATEDTTDSNNVHLDFYTNSAVALDGETIKMRLTSGGNLGIGNSSPDNTLSLGEIGSIGQDVNSLYVGGNFTGTGANFKKTGNYSQQLMFDTSAGSIIFKNTASTGTAGNAISYSERMRIDASGRLLVGTSSDSSSGRLVVQGSPAASGVDGVLVLKRASNNPASGTQGLGVIDFKDLSDGHGASIQAVSDGGWNTPSDCPTRLVFSVTADGASSPTERMRIHNGGTITCTALPGYNVIEACSAGAVTNTRFIRFNVNTSTEVGSIQYNGSGTNYVTSSDYRLKENLLPLEGAISRVSQLPVYRFNFISNPDQVVDGFIAHEVQTVVPEAITGTKDEVDDDGSPIYQGIDQSKLVPLLTAALQEAVAKIESLEARLTALESA